MHGTMHTRQTAHTTAIVNSTSHERFRITGEDSDYYRELLDDLPLSVSRWHCSKHAEAKNIKYEMQAKEKCFRVSCDMKRCDAMHCNAMAKRRSKCAGKRMLFWRESM